MTRADLCEVFLPDSDDVAVILRRHWRLADPSVGVHHATLAYVEPLAADGSSLGHGALCALGRVNPSASEALYEHLHCAAERAEAA